MTTHRWRSDASPSPPPPLLARLQSIASHVQMRKYSSKKEGEGIALTNGSSTSVARQGFIDTSSWRFFDSRTVGIPQSAIPHHVWTVLKIFKQKGFEAYLVGGCVRDLLLNRVPKDFDVITTASLDQIKKNIFKHCMIIGRRFPICQINMLGSIIEVSSFATNARNTKGNRPVDCSEMLNGCDEGNILRWKNSMKRDFTINGLFFNPMSYRIYDYVNGVRDMRKNKVCTVIPAHVSFKEDSARILRGLRIAARLGFQFSKETSTAIRDLSSSIINIDKTRLLMEMNFMLAYGAAESSIKLLQKYGLLDILLPFHAAYLSDQTKNKSSDRDLMLMKLFANLDKLLSADRPGHCSLWLGLLAFHNALVNSPQDPVVVRAFAAMLYFGTWERTIKFLKQDIRAPALFVPEILESSETKLDDLMEQTSQLASLVNASVNTLTNLDALEQSLARFSHTSQVSGIVFVSKGVGRKLLLIFRGLDSDLTSYDERRGGHEIDYNVLKHGHTKEVQFVLGKVIMDTMSEKLPSPSTEDVAVNSRQAANSAVGNHHRLSTLFH